MSERLYWNRCEERTKIFLEDPEQKSKCRANVDHSSKLKNQVLLEAREVEEKYFKDRYSARHWTGLFRLCRYLFMFHSTHGRESESVISLV